MAATTVPPLSFLDLPGEIRNVIYELSIGAKKVELVARGTLHLDRPSNRSTWQGPDAVRCMKSQLGGPITDADKRATNWQRSVTGLHLVNRQISSEVLAPMRTYTIFCFRSPRSVRSFLHLSPSHTLPHVRVLALRIQTYGQPAAAPLKRFVHKSYASWSAVAALLASQLPNLSALRFDVDVRDTPLVFAFDMPWLRCLRSFATFPRLTRASVRLSFPAVREAREALAERPDLPSPVRAYDALCKHFGAALEAEMMGVAEEEIRVRLGRALVLEREELLAHMDCYTLRRALEDWASEE